MYVNIRAQMTVVFNVLKFAIPDQLPIIGFNNARICLWVEIFAMPFIIQFFGCSGNSYIAICPTDIVDEITSAHFVARRFKVRIKKRGFYHRFTPSNLHAGFPYKANPSVFHL